ncbi:regulator of telomere elongation helicase 1 homolog isoform X3 [Cannabis sativa]|uniref:regulator of telomere elongation helicase 1 homolog isoform X3 n=1 Tax=Cannabis sativa TaxID=3483 RepID=UPI0029C9C065|nr:regulator of telomere elongation helicase 1 homolog isoform X3 [Cannabis sativa]
MPTYRIRGIDVDFPFEAYDCQLVYMEKVIQALQEKCNALLESPTGTGKTLCLLCATLAWRKSLGGFSTGVNLKSSQNAGGSEESPSQSGSSNLPTIIYTSRTHSQIRQVIKELKRSSYRHRLWTQFMDNLLELNHAKLAEHLDWCRPKMVVLGSREQLCIHEQVSSLHGKAQSNACQMLRRNRQRREEHEKQENQGRPRCAHYLHVADYLKSNPHLGDEPIDIEDLVNIGKSFGPCPYYMSREIHKVVDILFAPYNYLIDRAYRKSLTINWQNSVLIFDEAHNLEGLCADAASFDLSSKLLTACISEAKNCIDISVKRRQASDDKSNNPDNFAILRALLLKLEKRIAEVPIESKDLGFTKPGPYIYELLADLNITPNTSSKLVGIIDEATQLLEEDNQLQGKNSACRLESIGSMLNLIFRQDNSHAKYYLVHVQEVDASASDGLRGKASRTLSWWCFNPGIAMEEFSKLFVGSIILTSGTLSPMDSFAQELKLDFPVRLENPHVINSNQIWAGVVPVGPSGYSFNSSYRSRDTLEYKQELGNAMVNFARIVPDGLLVFFPSYYLLDQCIGCWKTASLANSTTIWERICKHKKPVVEPRQSSLFSESIEDYMAKLKDTSSSGAIFFAVCRGKVSEGLDFADHAGRAVIVTGMPFATLTDHKVRLKRLFLDEQAQRLREACKTEVLTGEEWYSQQATRAVNQAVGRVIRHRHDYGAIIFCDERFSHSNRQSQISLWIQPHLKCYSKFGDIVFTLTRFFRDGKNLGPTKLELPKTEKLGDLNSSIKSAALKHISEAPLDNISSLLASSMSADAGNATEKLEDFTRLTAAVGEDFSILLEKVQPANRASLSCCKDKSSILTSSNEQICNEKKLLISAGRAQYQNVKCDSLDNNSILDRESFRGLLAPCPSKKRKSIGTKPSVSLHESFSDYSSRMRNSEPNSSSSKSQECDKGIDSAERSIQSAQVDNVEARGSEFLIQVGEKLSISEYKEFVNSMKALKSKAVKINEVFRSIVGIFSGPERFPLLVRFKDFIPAKYHALYDQYLGANDKTTKSPEK